MEEITAWCKTVCIVSVVSGVLVSVLPKNKLIGAVKTLSAVILVWAFITPIVSFDKDDFKLDFSSNRYEYEELESLASDEVLRQAEEILKKETDSILIGVNPEARSYVKMFYNDGETGIEKITVSGKLNDSEKDKIRSLIKDKFQKDIYIEFSG